MPEIAHSSFEHATYQKMIQIAAHATKNVHILNRKQAQETIIVKFKEQMKALRDRLNVRYLSSLL